MTEGEIDNLLHYVPIAMRSSAVNDWERKFLISIAGRMKRGAFRPSAKQLPILKWIIDNFKEQNLGSEVTED